MMMVYLAKGNFVFIFAVLLQSLAQDDVRILVDGYRLLYVHPCFSLHLPVRQIPTLLDRISSHFGYFVSSFHFISTNSC